MIRVTIRIMLAACSAVALMGLGVVVAIIAASFSTPPVYAPAVAGFGEGYLSIEYIFLSMLVSVPVGIASAWLILRGMGFSERDGIEASSRQSFFWDYRLCSAKNTTGEIHEGRHAEGSAEF